MKKLLLVLFILPSIVFAQPANDDPCGAISLAVQTGGYCNPTNPYSWTGATGTAGIPAPGCGSYSTGDIWFKFVAPVGGRVYITVIEGSIVDGAMAVYGTTSNSCSNPFTLIICDDDSGPGSMPYIIATGLTPGNTYFIRFWEFNDVTSGSIGGICVTNPSPALSTGRVGVGIENGDATLDVNGNIKIRGGSPAGGKVLMSSDAQGLAIWSTPTPAYVNPSIGTAFSVNRVVGGQTVGSHGSYKKLAFPNIKFNDGPWTASDSTYTCPATGAYHFDAQISWQPFSYAGTALFYVTLFVDGGFAYTVIISGTYAEVVAQRHMVISGIVKCDAGQKVWVSVYQESGINQPVDGDGTYFNGYRVY